MFELNSHSSPMQQLLASFSRVNFILDDDVHVCGSENVFDLLISRVLDAELLRHFASGLN